MQEFKNQNAKFKVQNETRMMRSTAIKAILILTFAICILQFAFVSAASAALTVKANHDHITIDFLYHGSSVSVKGEADAGRDLVIKITSPEGHQVLKQKGKVAGLLWMNVGTLKFEQTPNLYEVYSTKKLDEMLSTEEMDRAVIGYPALMNHVDITPVKDETEKTAWFKELVKFKEDQHLYAESFGKIATTIKANGRQEYYILLPWPYQAAPGTYTLTVYAVKGNKVVEKAETNVTVEQVGTVKALAGMANNSGALYGLLSIGIALAAGFGVGMIFRKGGGSH